MSANKEKPEQDRAITTDIVKQFLDTQAAEISVRKDEIALHQEELRVKESGQQRGYEFSLKSLDAQKDDRKDSRNASVSLFKWIISGGIFCFIILVCACVIALYFNKDQIVLEVLKFVGYFAAGGVGGFGISEAKRSKKNDDEGVE